jgi:hypothetical protein
MVAEVGTVRHSALPFPLALAVREPESPSLTVSDVCSKPAVRSLKCNSPVARISHNSDQLSCFRLTCDRMPEVLHKRAGNFRHPCVQ